jgi:hypothetical protein
MGQSRRDWKFATPGRSRACGPRHSAPARAVQKVHGLRLPCVCREDSSNSAVTLFLPNTMNDRIERVQAHCARHVFNRCFRFAEINSHPATEVPCRCQVRLEFQRPVNQGGASVELAKHPGEREPSGIQCDSIVLSQASRLPGKTFDFDVCLRIVGQPAVVLTQDVAPRGHSISSSIAGVEFDSPVERSQRLADARRASRRLMLAILQRLEAAESTISSEKRAMLSMREP